VPAEPRQKRWIVAGCLSGLLVAVLAFVALRAFQSASGVPAQTLNSTVIVRQIQKLNDLVSVKYTLQKAVGLEEQKYPLGSEKILLFVQAEVLAGIDLSKLTEHDVQTSTAGIKLVLPPPRIIQVVIDDKETKVWDRRITWWTPWVPYNQDLERQARLAARDSIEKAALEAGILEQAKRNAEATIRGLLETLGVKTIVVEQSS